MRPLIGIPLRYDVSKKETSLSYLYDSQRLSVQKLGADILPIPPVIEVDNKDTKLKDYPSLSKENIKSLNRYLDMCDGIILPGGIKILPSDRYILEYAINNKIPILGICLGMQTMSCYNEDIALEENEKYGINHDQNDDEKYKHNVIINKDSLLYKIIGEERIMVNSFHKKHVTPNFIYNISAYSEDGLIEAVEFPSNTFNIGVQWHPERMCEFDEPSKKLMTYFIKECEKNRKKKAKNVVKL